MRKSKGFFRKVWEILDPRDLIAGAGVTIRYFFSTPVTIQYPFNGARRKVAPRFKGVLALVPDKYGDDKCIGCMQCVKICPVDCLTVVTRKMTKEEGEAHKSEVKKRFYIETFEVDLQRCMLCSLCVEVCPTQALEMSHDVHMVMTDRESQIYDRIGMLTAGRATHTYKTAKGKGEIETEELQPIPPPAEAVKA
jgi:NADH-quinone oxidoreductase subunit I